MSYVKQLSANASNKAVIDALNAGADRNPTYAVGMRLQNPRIERILASAGITHFDASGKILVADLDKALKGLEHPMTPIEKMTLKGNLRALGCLA